MTENKPFIEDVYPCVLCGSKASYMCPNCQVKLCKDCVVKRHGKPENNRYCPKCLCKVSEIPKRFIGSTTPQRKWHTSTKGMKPHMEATKIYPRSDREKIQQQNRGETTE